MNIWYAIRLKPNAQRPSRQDSRITNIGFSLSRAGFDYYMPMEKREIVHHRTKKLIDKSYALIPGYAFVCDVEDWFKLHQCDFVAGVLGIRGDPLELPSDQISEIMLAERAVLDEYERKKQIRINKDREREERKKHIPRSRAQVLYPAGSPISVVNSHYMLGGKKGRVIDVTGRQTIKVMFEELEQLGNVELSFNYVEKVA